MSVPADVDALMRRAFTLPPPPRPTLPQHEPADAPMDTPIDAPMRTPADVATVTPTAASPDSSSDNSSSVCLLADDALDALAAAGPSLAQAFPQSQPEHKAGAGSGPVFPLPGASRTTK